MCLRDSGEKYALSQSDLRPLLSALPRPETFRLRAKFRELVSGPKEGFAMVSISTPLCERLGSYITAEEF